MRCPECAADISPLREYCPKCGASTDPAARSPRSRTPGQRPPDDQLKRNRNRLFAVGGGILLTVGVLSAGNWIDFDSSSDDGHHSEMPQPQGAATVEADEVYRAFRDDPHAAGMRFGDREMVVSGEFLRIVPDGYGSLDLRLKTSNPDAPLGIDIADIGIEDAKKLVPGQRVTVSCENMGDGGEVLWVRNCVVQAAPAQTAPSTPTAPTAPSPPEPGDGNSG